MELQGRYDEIRKQGLGLVAISYDSPETLKRFAESRAIRFPLISDAGSVIITRYGILNEQQKPGTALYGVPHPGTFVVDRKGVVTARFFEDAYQERYTAAAILAAQGINPDGTSLTAQTNHLRLSATISDATVAPGERVSIVVVVTPQPTMHVYAPGKDDYRVVRLNIDLQPWLRGHETRYPKCSGSIGSAIDYSFGAFFSSPVVLDSCTRVRRNRYRVTCHARLFIERRRLFAHADA